MPLQEFLIPEFVNPPLASKEDASAPTIASLMDVEDIQMLLNQESFDLNSLDKATRAALIAMLEQEIQRLEPIVNSQSLSETVRKIAFANR
jgi:hypothetical protein